jgi:hypothetical protein
LTCERLDAISWAWRFYLRDGNTKTWRYWKISGIMGLDWAPTAERIRLTYNNCPKHISMFFALHLFTFSIARQSGGRTRHRRSWRSHFSLIRWPCIMHSRRILERHSVQGKPIENTFGRRSHKATPSRPPDDFKNPRDPIIWCAVRGSPTHRDPSCTCAQHTVLWGPRYIPDSLHVPLRSISPM